MTIPFLSRAPQVIHAYIIESKESKITKVILLVFFLGGISAIAVGIVAFALPNTMPIAAAYSLIGLGAVGGGVSAAVRVAQVRYIPPTHPSTTVPVLQTSNASTAGQAAPSSENNQPTSSPCQAPVTPTLMDTMNTAGQQPLFRSTPQPTTRLQAHQGLPEALPPRAIENGIPVQLPLEGIHSLYRLLSKRHRGFGARYTLELEDVVGQGADNQNIYQPRTCHIWFTELANGRKTINMQLEPLEGPIGQAEKLGIGLHKDATEVVSVWFENRPTIHNLMPPEWERRLDVVLTKLKPVFVTLPDDFSPAELQLLRVLLQKYNQNNYMNIHVNCQPYAVWFNGEYQAINMQPIDNFRTGSQTNKVGLVIGTEGTENGRIQSIWINGEESTHPLFKRCVSPSYQAHIKTVFASVLKSSTRYVEEVCPATRVGTIKGQFVHLSLQSSPEFHIHHLVTHLESIYKKENIVGFPIFTVRHLKPEDLTPADGIDAGGLRRDWFHSCLRGFLEKNNAQRIENTSLYMPMVQPFSSYGFYIDDTVRKDYEDLGRLLMHILHQPRESAVDLQVAWFTGNLLPPAFFAGIVAWPGKEIEETNLFHEVSIQAQVQVCRAILQAHHIHSYDKIIQWILKEKWNQADAEGAVQYIEAIGETVASQVVEAVQRFAELNDLQKQELIKKLRLALADMLLNLDSSIGVLGRVVAALYHIAIGMRGAILDKRDYLSAHPLQIVSKMTQEWNTRFHKVYRQEIERQALGYPIVEPIIHTLSTRIQGVVERKTVVDSICIEGALSPHQKQEVEKKVNWLKEWLRDTATEVEVANFITFVTGSGLGHNQKIKIYGKNQSPLPVAHTCYSMMDISYSSTLVGAGGFSDRTKEGFIACLKESLSTLQADGFTLA